MTSSHLISACALCVATLTGGCANHGTTASPPSGDGRSGPPAVDRAGGTSAAGSGGGAGRNDASRAGAGNVATATATTTSAAAGERATPAADGGSGGSASVPVAGSAPAADGGSGALPQSGAILAFPGAQGFGKHVTGGRHGKVVHVTQLSDSGSGSFRDAVSGANRFVVFDVGGYIQLATAVSVKSDITIAGQTAPGGGIGFRGGEISFAGSSNIIMRHVRIRPGSETASTEDDALSLYRAHDVIIDHASLELAPWNNIDGVSDDWQKYPVTNITIQDSLIADPIGQQFGAHTESVSSQWAWYRNIFANSHNRNPLAKTDTVFVNNLLYNCSAGYTTHTSTSFKHDIVNNYFVFGPASSGTDNTWYQIDKNQSIYCAGNLKDVNTNAALDGETTTPSWYQGPGTVLQSAWSNETTSTPPLDAGSAARAAISLSGAWPRDALDDLIIGQVMTLGKGSAGLGAGSAGPAGDLYTSQMQTGLMNDGYGSIASATPPVDSDHDGMPDTWESALGGNPKSDDAMSKAADGYSLLEQYVNWLAGLHATSSAGAAVDVDLSTYTRGFDAVSPSFTLMGAEHGEVTLAADKHSAHFQPTKGFQGLAAFSFKVSGTDGSAHTAQVQVLVSE